MNWPPLELVDNDTLIVSPSQLSLMQRCYRMWGFKYLCKREPARTSVSAGAGKAFHSALEPRNRAKGAITPDVVASMHEKLVEGFRGVEVPDDEYRNLGRYQRVLDAYNTHWRDEELETLAVEVQLMVKLGDITMPEAWWKHHYRDCKHEFKLSPINISGRHVCTGQVCLKCGGHGWVEDHGILCYEYKPVQVYLKGIVDRLVRHRRDGMVLVADTKTTKDWRDSNQVMWERASAPRAYTWGLMELARQDPSLGLPEKVHGFLLDSVVVRREASTLKRPRKEGIDDQTFQRIIFPYDSDTLEEWRRDALGWCRSLLRQLGEDGDLLMNSNSCSNFYGQRCPFLDVCQEPDRDGKRELVLSFDRYTTRKESPFERANEAVVSVEEEL